MMQEQCYNDVLLTWLDRGAFVLRLMTRCSDHDTRS